VAKKQGVRFVFTDGSRFIFRLSGKALQVEPMKPVSKAPGTKRLNVKYDTMLSFQLAALHSGTGSSGATVRMVRRCRLTLSNPR